MMFAGHILLVDDHEIFRHGLKTLLKEAFPEIPLSEAESIEQALSLDILPPQLVLLDIKLPGLTGLEGIIYLKQRWPDIMVLVLSALDAPECIAYGAIGHVSKRESTSRLLGQIADVIVGNIQSPVISPNNLGALTPRQREVLDLLGRGFSNKLIARQLALAENTVRRHVQDILEQFEVSSRTEAIAVARRRGVIE